MKAPPFGYQAERHSARSLALHVLLESARPGAAFVQETLDRALNGEGTVPPPAAAADRRLATGLVYGVLRRRGTLLALLEPLVTRPLKQVEPWLWDTLALGAYQLALMDQIPAHAALHATVELAAQFGRPGAKGFLNGILRSLTGLLTADRTEAPAADALPVDGGVYRRLTRPALPDPERSPVGYLAAGFGLPVWLAERWCGRMGPDEARRLGFWFAGPAALTLRCNPLRTDRESLLSALGQADHAAEPGEHPQAIRLRDHAAVRDLPGYEEGWFSVQDESAMRVASALAPEPGSTVLDLCAAPGGKATHLAELMGDRGRVVACDPDARRLALLGGLARRLGLKCVETHLLPPERSDDLPVGTFDAALVDVPCSNTGVLGRRPEVRWRLRPGEFRHLAALQRTLLRRALERVRPGGVVVYSTCSIEPEENGELVASVLRAVGGWAVEAEGEAVPGRPADGGYWARLRRREGA